MIRITVLTMMVLCFGTFTDILTAENDDGATIKGKVIDITPDQKPYLWCKGVGCQYSGWE